MLQPEANEIVYLPFGNDGFSANEDQVQAETADDVGGILLF